MVGALMRTNGTVEPKTMQLSASVDHAQLLPTAAEILEQVLYGLPIADIGRLQQTSRHSLAAADERRPWILRRRRVEASWTWRKVHAAEVALFYDLLGSPSLWNPGPNLRHHNVLECGGSDENDDTVDDALDHPSARGGPWLWLSGGTDWQAFQGGFRSISEDGIKPTWLTFRVRIATPELSCAFLTFASARRTWGLEKIVLAFHYSGDERLTQRRCFIVQAGATQHGDASHVIRLQPEIVADQPYQVAVKFDWDASVMSVFIDGVEHIHCAPFKTEEPIRFAAIYNWRSGARTAFSELLRGNACAYSACDSSAQLPKPRGCCKRRVPPKNASPNVFGSAGVTSTSTKLLLTSAIIVLLASVMMQQQLLAVSSLS